MLIKILDKYYFREKLYIKVNFADSGKIHESVFCLIRVDMYNLYYLLLMVSPRSSAIDPDYFLTLNSRGDKYITFLTSNKNYL